MYLGVLVLDHNHDMMGSMDEGEGGEGIECETNARGKGDDEEGRKEEEMALVEKD